MIFRLLFRTPSVEEMKWYKISCGGGKGPHNNKKFFNVIGTCDGTSRVII